MPVVLEDPEKGLYPDATLDHAAPLGPKEFQVRPVNRAVNKPAEKSIEAIEADPNETREGEAKKLREC
jgi:hypothetical protein